MKKIVVVLIAVSLAVAGLALAVETSKMN